MSWAMLDKSLARCILLTMVVLADAGQVTLAGQAPSAPVGSHEEEMAADEVGNEVGGIVGDVEIEGVAILNGNVYVDGELVAKGKRKVVSRKTGKTYLIEWGKNNNVSVTEK